ncbi:I78 family peptidase inhibitor [Roseivivax sp.]
MQPKTAPRLAWLLPLLLAACAPGGAAVGAPGVPGGDEVADGGPGARPGVPGGAPGDGLQEPGSPDADSCGAEGYRALVGSPLAAVTLPADLDARIIRPGDMVTMDYSESRLNIALDAEGVITRVYCG